MRFAHPHLLGVTAQHMPLLGAAVHIASVRAPQVVFADLLAASELRSLPAVREFRRAAGWLAGKCAEPGGLTYAYQDPKTGELHRLPSSALWEASLVEAPEDGEALEAWIEWAAFRRVVAQRLGVEDCSPAFQVVVPKAELQALLGAEVPMQAAWCAMHVDDVTARIHEAIEADPTSAIAEWALTCLHHQLPMIVAVHDALTGRTVEPHDSVAPRNTTKSAVAIKEAEFRRRWQQGEFATPTAAREALMLELNAREDGTVARKGDPDFHARASVDRLTRGWFA